MNPRAEDVIRRRESSSLDEDARATTTTTTVAVEETKECQRFYPPTRSAAVVGKVRPKDYLTYVSQEGADF